jgi:hypothetical protein
MREILFSETQRFKQWWIYMICIIIDVIFIFGFIWQVILGHQFGNNPAPNYVDTIVMIAMLIITSSIFFGNLKTVIKKDGIYYRFFPLNLRIKKLSLGDISEAYIREYDAMGEYLGWGIRYGDSMKDKAIILGGDKGIQIVFKNNKKLLLGTLKPLEAKKALEGIGFKISDENS